VVANTLLICSIEAPRIVERANATRERGFGGIERERERERDRNGREEERRKLLYQSALFILFS